MPKTTISVIKCDVGSLAGHHITAKPIMDVGETHLKRAQKGLINSYYVFHAGDDLELLMVHQKGEDNPKIRKIAFDAFMEASKKVFDGPPRLVALGLQLCDGYIASDDDGNPLVSDLFDDPAFDMARREAQEYAAKLRYMGEFEPPRLSAETMEYTTLPQVLEHLEKRFKKA